MYGVEINYTNTTSFHRYYFVPAFMTARDRLNVTKLVAVGRSLIKCKYVNETAR